MENEVYETGYKAYNPGLSCNGKQYEEGQVYEESGGKICGPGLMHYCVNPFDVLTYYPLVNADGTFSDFTTVEALAKPVRKDDKSATQKIRIGAKLGFDGFIKACIDFIYEKTIKDMPTGKVSSGRYAQIGSSGYAAQIGSSGRYAQIGSSGDAAKIGSSGEAAKIGSSGDDAKIGSSGYAAQIGSSGDAAKIGSSGDAAKIGSSGDAAKIGSSGDAAKIGSSGDAAKIGSSGRYAQIGSSGDDAVVICEADNAVVGCVGKRAKIKAPLGTWITLAEYGDWDGEGYPCLCVKSARIDGEMLKPGAFYTLKNGEFTEFTEDTKDE